MINPFSLMGADEYMYTLGEPDVLYNSNSTDEVSLMVMGVVYSVIFVIFVVPTVVGMWKLFQKAGKPGWAAIVPIYNLYIWLQVVGRPSWWMALFLLAFIPFVGWIPALVALIIVCHDTSKSFGKDVGYTILQIFVPFVAYPLMGFGDAKYVGPAAAPKDDGAAKPHGPASTPAV